MQPPLEGAGLITLEYGAVGRSLVTVAGQVYRLPEQLDSRRKQQQPPDYFMQSPIQEHLPQDLHETSRLDTASQPRGASPLPGLGEALYKWEHLLCFMETGT